MLTELEQKVMDCLLGKLDAEPGFSDVGSSEIADATEIKMKALRGVLSSLIKKGMIFVDESSDLSIVHLDKKFYHLHPKWSVIEQ